MEVGMQKSRTMAWSSTGHVSNGAMYSAACSSESHMHVACITM